MVIAFFSNVGRASWKAYTGIVRNNSTLVLKKALKTQVLTNVLAKLRSGLFLLSIDETTWLDYHLNKLYPRIFVHRNQLDKDQVYVTEYKNDRYIF